MTTDPITIAPDEKAYRALELMEKRERPIGILPVVTKNGSFEGFITLHALIKVGFSEAKIQLEIIDFLVFLSYQLLY